VHLFEELGGEVLQVVYCWVEIERLENGLSFAGNPFQSAKDMMYSLMI
jgi:hypothetical protein